MHKIGRTFNWYSFLDITRRLAVRPSLAKVQLSDGTLFQVWSYVVEPILIPDFPCD